MGDRTNRSPDETTEVEQCDTLHPEHQATCDRAQHDDAPSSTDLDEREARRSTQRKAAGPGGRRGHDRASHTLPDGNAADADASAGAAHDDAEAETAPETRLEP